MHISHETYHATIFEGWQFPNEVDAQREFRKRLFIDELGWDLVQENGLEFDEFDTPNAVFCSLYLGDAIVGTLAMQSLDVGARSVQPMSI